MNNYNMSDYQKIFFLKGLDEQNQNLSVLSNNYPFVMFISNGQTYYDNKPIRNIWFDGVRLTRFIGVDNEHNSIKIGDHTLKLNFDYETGLLSIIDDVKLIKLKLISYSYIPVNSTNETTVLYNDAPINIFAADNKFSLIFEYQYETDSDDVDITNISKTLSYNSNNFTKVNNNLIQKISNDIIQYQFTYNITNALFNNSNINFISQYSNDKQVNTQMLLYLNPIDYTINISNTNVNNGSSIKLEPNKQYNITLYFSPQVYSTDQLNLWVKMNIYDQYSILKNTSNTYTSVILSGGIATFTINTVELLPNINNIIANLSFEVYCKKNNEEIKYNNLNKSISLTFDTEVTEAYFYFGYQNELLINIESESFVTYAEGLIHNYANKDLGNYIFDVNYNESEDFDKYLYCIIPVSYTGIGPKFNAREHNSTYVSVLNTWFVKLGTKILNNVECNIYKKKLRGEFFGIIK